MEILKSSQLDTTHCVHRYSNWRGKLRKGSCDAGQGILFLIPRGNLLSRSLVDIAKPDDFVQTSEYLQTLVVCVPRYFTVTLWCVICYVHAVVTGTIIENGNGNTKL